MFEAEAEAEAKILASTSLWPRGLNITALMKRFSKFIRATQTCPNGFQYWVKTAKQIVEILLDSSA